MKNEIVIFWLRRDLRIDDNAALYHALKSGYPVLPVFIYDRLILNQLSENDARVNFIHQQLQALHLKLQSLQSALYTLLDTPQNAWETLTQKFQIKAVYTNHDYEPYAQQRDGKIAELLAQKSIDFYTFKDQCIFEKNEITKDDGSPYSVFTPYKKKWLATLNNFYIKSYPCEKYHAHFYNYSNHHFLSLEAINFKINTLEIPAIQLKNISNYAETRDFPAIAGTSKASIYLRFGVYSIRKLVALALAQKAEKWLDELIWREFYMTILWHFPHTVTQAFKPKYDRIQWRNNEAEFAAWCQGNTGYPLVDAAMRELNHTGWMHNRMRMLTASFLIKHLLIDWRWGEAYFAEKLLDYEQASNIGGWQWVFGSGNDGAPYFRIFNPSIQQKKFDKDGIYIKKWVPELNSLQYPAPIVNHEMARDRCLKIFGEALQ